MWSWGSRETSCAQSLPFANTSCSEGVDPDGKAVRKPWFVEQLRSILSSIGAPQHQYAGHSFRIGAATTAALAGVEDSTTQALGRWHSAAFLQYIRTPRHVSQSRWPRPANRRPSSHCWGCGGHHTPCMHMSHFIHVVIVSLLSFVLN